MSRKPTAGSRKQKRTILLVTNGHVTEKHYLDELKRIANQDKSMTVKTKSISGLDPMGVLNKLANPQGDISNYDEVWIVVDHDGIDRTQFLKRCEKMSTRSTRVRGIVSVPCFEVWLIAHYKQVGLYPDQDAAQRDFSLVTGRHKDTKELPADFPWDKVEEACTQCHLAQERIPDIDEQGGPSSTGMPHLIYSLGLARPPR